MCLRACTRLDSGLSTMEMRWNSKPALRPTVSPSLHSDSVEYMSGMERVKQTVLKKWLLLGV